ncbi:MAG: ABC transporter ATP-binding protein [Candidatus Woesearchaeota archaeon]
MASPIIELRNVSEYLDKKKVLDSISLTVKDKEILGVIGPSGSGKTVLLKTIIGFYKPKQGSILYCGKNMSSRKDILKTIGFASQRNSIYYDLSPKENLYYFGRMYGMKGKEIKANCEELLKLTGLWEHRKKIAMKLSGGMQKRLDLACSLIHKPKLLILDEPISGLDPVLRENMLALIQSIRNKGTSIIISSHFMQEIEPICNRIAIIRSGKLLAIGRTVDIVNYYSKLYEVIIRTYPGNYPILQNALIKSGIKIVQSSVGKGTLTIQVPQTSRPSSYLQAVIKALPLAREELLDIRLNKMSLNEVFRRITSRK